MVLAQHNLEYEGLLYPLMVIAAVAVIVFSLLGIATVSGWLPNALRSTDGIELSSATLTHTDAGQSGAFACAECGVIDSLRASRNGQQE